MNTGKGTDDTSDRGKEAKTSLEACVSTCSRVGAPGGKEGEEKGTPSWPLFCSPRSSPKKHMVIPK